jgi:lipid-A-disaccharide synthase
VTGQQPRKVLDKTLDVFIVAGESSADDLGARFMRSVSALRPVSFRGVGGARMSAAGLASLYPAQGLFSIGFGTVIAKLPLLLRRMRETVDAIVAAPPDVLLLIDAPDFTHRIAARVRRRLPHLPIVKYVSPSVWVWRPGRARAMRSSIDLVLALLPFEPEVHRQLGGPDCVYVGHSLLEHLSDLRPAAEEERLRSGSPPLVLALPGSRTHEVERLATIFGETLGMVAAKSGPLEVVLPTVPHLVARLSEATSRWPIRPRIVVDEAEKHAAFRRARAALAASGTVTLELALAGVPSVAAYRVPVFEELMLRMMVRIHPVIKVRSVILANLVLGEFAIPEFLQKRCAAENLAAALTDILGDTPGRRRQIEAFKRLEAIMGTGGVDPSKRAAQAVLDLVERRSAIS